MRQGWKIASLCMVLALATAVAPSFDKADAASTPKSKAESAKPSKTTRLRQFTGWVTSIEKQSFTVEKRTKKETLTQSFDRHAEMRISGNLEEGARVTVYFRSDGKRSVAHRVVVKAPPDEGAVEE